MEWEALLDLRGAANRHITRYDGLLQSVVNHSLLLLGRKLRPDRVPADHKQAGDGLEAEAIRYQDKTH
ncbi:MAG: hypothetical protein ACK5XP_12480 [Sphingobacteriia bacterium]